MHEEIDKQRLMKIANGAVDQAQFLFMRDGFLSPIALAVKGQSIVPVCFSGEDSKEDQAAAIKALADADCGAVIFVTDAEVADSDDPNVKCIEDVPKEDRTSAILTLIYTRKGTIIRRTLYAMNKEAHRPNFADFGWEEGFKVDQGSVFANPYGV